jgi:hypothetical protein
MATYPVKYQVSAQGSNIAGTTLDSLANGSTSAFITYDNSGNLDEYAAVEITIGTQGANRATGAGLVLRVYAVAGATPTDTGSVNGGDSYPIPTTSGTTAACTVTIPKVALYPFSLRFQVTNNTGQALGASGNSIKVTPYNDSLVV